MKISDIFQYFIILFLLAPFIGGAQTNSAPFTPILIAPADQSTGNATDVTLSVEVGDPDPGQLTVTLIGRKKPGPSEDFTIMGLPDTQYYTGPKYGGLPEMFYSQTQWIVDNRVAENIVYVVQEGDCVQTGDEFEDEWKRADTAIRIIEDPLTTMLAEGIPYVISVGNHDQSPIGNPNGTTDLFNAYFGEARFAGRSYYGGHYGDKNNNSYHIFSAGGIDFIVISLEYDPYAKQSVLNWVDDILLANSHRKAIIVSHYIIGTGNPGAFGAQGQEIYNQVKDNPNVFLMLCGHIHGEGQRTDVYNGDTIHTVLADYQMRTDGGTGWFRIMRFSPENNSISFKTYSPWLDEWETDEDSEFELPFNMNDAGLDTLAIVSNVSPGSVVNIPWSDLDPNTEYEWFVEVNDGYATTRSPRWTFTTWDHQLDLKAFLEGPFNGSSMNVNSTAVTLQQPYSALPWNYSGTESVNLIPPDIIDWLLIELRDAANPALAGGETRVYRRAAFLKANGDVVDLDGYSPVSFPVNVDQNLFVILWHRNHLPLMSAIGLNGEQGVFQYDFTQDANASYGGNSACAELPGARYGMPAGDVNADGSVNLLDLSNWSYNAGQSGYLNNDLNLDTHTDNNDKNSMWLHNYGKSSQVPQ
ncbi:MAG: metallophosphoesterase [Bacteroidales bacterium]|nr:metallophosphoesterase [Bacteroidales bacterium]